MSNEQLRHEEEKYHYDEAHREYYYPRTNAAYHKSRRNNSDKIDALLAECEKMEHELKTQRKLQIMLYNAGYQAGHNDSVESCFIIIDEREKESYHAEEVAELVSDYFHNLNQAP